MEEYIIACMRHTGRNHYVVSLWGADHSGYTPDLNECGRYSEADAMKINHGTDDIAIKLSDAMKMSVERDYNYTTWKKGRFILNDEVFWNMYGIKKTKLYKSSETLKQWFRYCMEIV